METTAAAERKKLPLPDATIAKAGRDIFSTRKDVTVVMAPYERYSVFPKAIDELYRNFEIPFNLIVMEGGAPDFIRNEIEKRQAQHSNLTVLYSHYRPGLYGAFNLALPHIKTPFAFFIDNEIRIPSGAMASLIREAGENEADLVFPRTALAVRKIRRGTDGPVEEIEAPGAKTCFVMSRDAIRRIGKFDEELMSLHAGIDLMLRARQAGFRIRHAAVPMESCPETAPESIDVPLYTVQWDPARIKASENHLANRWAVQALEDGYRPWIEAKIGRSRELIRLRKKIHKLQGGGLKRMLAPALRLGFHPAFSVLRQNVSFLSRMNCKDKT